MVPRIVVESVNNKQLSHSFHLNIAIASLPHVSFKRPIERTSSLVYLRQGGRLAAGVVRKLLNIPGVIEVGIRAYMVDVQAEYIGFDWSDIEPRVIAVLLTAFANPGEVQVVDKDGKPYPFTMPPNPDPFLEEPKRALGDSLTVADVFVDLLRGIRNKFTKK